MQFKGTSGYIKDKLIKNQKGKSLVYAYDRLKKGSFFSSKNIYVKKGNKLFRLEDSYSFLRKIELLEKYSKHEVEKIINYQKGFSINPIKLDTETKKKLESYLIKIFSCSTITLYYDPLMKKSSNFTSFRKIKIYDENIKEYSEELNKYTISMSKYFLDSGIDIKRFIEGLYNTKSNQLYYFIQSLHNGRLSFYMSHYFIGELRKYTDNKFGRVTSFSFDKSTIKMLNEIYDEMIIYKVKNEKKKEVDTLYDRRLVNLISIKDGIKVSGLEISKYINDDIGFEKVLSSGNRYTPPKSYRKSINSTNRSKMNNIIKCAQNGKIDIEDIFLGKSVKNAVNYW